MTAAHDQSLTLHIITHVPEHEPRKTDVHYHLFNEARRRLKAAGLLKCVIGDDYCSGGIELHHSHVEDSLQNGIDLEKVNVGLGLHLVDEEAFLQWVQSPGNLEPLCAVHHRTAFGIHVLPGPLWEPLRFRKAGIQPFAEFIPAKNLQGGDHA